MRNCYSPGGRSNNERHVQSIFFFCTNLTDNPNVALHVRILVRIHILSYRIQQFASGYTSSHDWLISHLVQNVRSKWHRLGNQYRDGTVVETFHRAMHRSSSTDPTRRRNKHNEPHFVFTSQQFYSFCLPTKILCVLALGGWRSPVRKCPPRVVLYPLHHVGLSGSRSPFTPCRSAQSQWPPGPSRPWCASTRASRPCVFRSWRRPWAAPAPT